MNDVTIKLDNNHLIVHGKLTQDTVMYALEQFMALLDHHDAIVVNLAGVTFCDSASLAFLMELLRVSKKRQIQLKICEMPKQLCDLARVSGVDNIFSTVES